MSFDTTFFGNGVAVVMMGWIIGMAVGIAFSVISKIASL